MIPCSKCKSNGTFWITDTNLILCAECIKKEGDKKNIQELSTISILNSKDKYVKIGDNYFTFSNFKQVNSSHFLYLNKLRDIHTKNEFIIILFPNKEESNKFTKEVFKKEGVGDKDSKYAVVLLNNKKYILLNHEKIRLEELPFILKHLDYKSDLEANNKLSNDFLNFYNDIIEIYNKRLGIQFVGGPKDVMDEEIKHFFVFRDNLFGVIGDFFSLRKLSKEFSDLTQEYINDVLYRFTVKSLKRDIDSLPGLTYLIGLLVTSIKLAVYKSINKEYQEVDKFIEELFKEVDWKEYSFLDRLLKNYISNLNDKLVSVQDFNDFLSVLTKETHNFMNKVPLAFVRLTELFVFAQQSENILTNFQFFPSQSSKNLPHVLEFLTITKRIRERTLNAGIKYFMYIIRWHIIQQYSIINKDKQMFDLAFQEANEEIIFFIDNIENIKKTFPSQKISIDDMILSYSGLSYLCYCMKEMDKYNEIRTKLNNLIEDKKASSFVKIMVNGQNFFMQEDYHSLRQIFRLFKNYDGSKIKGLFDSEIKTMGYFSEAFFSKDPGEKLELYSKAIQSNEEEPLLPSSFQFKANEKFIVYNLLKIFYHIENSQNQSNPYFIVSELKNALKYAEKDIKNHEEFESVQYYYYKTQIVNLIFEDNLPTLKEYLIKIKNFNFPSSISFQKFVEEVIQIINEDIQTKMHFMSNCNYTEDIWINLIKKYLRDTINKDYLGEYVSSKREVNKIDNMNELMLKFKAFILNDSVTGFWKQKGQLNAKAEDIGRNLLLMFLRTLDKFELNKESQVNFYRMDIFATEKKNTNNAYIFETKIFKSPFNYKKGIGQIKEKYFRYKKEINTNLRPFYIVFDDRAKSKEIREDIDFDGTNLSIVQIPISPLK